jgi:hypothetical protein
MSRTLVPPFPGRITGASGLVLGAAAVVSPIIDTWQCNFVSWEGLVTGTSAGALTIEGSNQYDPVAALNALYTVPTFVQMPATTPALPVLAGAGLSFGVTSPGPGGGGGGMRYQRMRHAGGAGAGVLHLWICGVGP